MSVADHNLVLPSPGQIRIFNDSGYELDARLTVYDDEWVLVIGRAKLHPDAADRPLERARRRGDTTRHTEPGAGAPVPDLPK